MDKQEKKQFNLFVEELKKYEVIDDNIAMVLLNRYIAPLTKRKFFKEEYKSSYYSYWFKIACKSGILERRNLGYKVKKL